MTWSNGKHAYYGKDNGRGKRQVSKIVKGLKIDHQKLRVAFAQVEREKQNEHRTRILQAKAREVLGTAENTGLGA